MCKIINLWINIIHVHMSFVQSSPGSFTSFKCVCVCVCIHMYLVPIILQALLLFRICEDRNQIMRERKVLETSLALILLDFREIAQGYTNPVFGAVEPSALTRLRRAAPCALSPGMCPLLCLSSAQVNYESTEEDHFE